MLLVEVHLQGRLHALKESESASSQHACKNEHCGGQQSLIQIK